MPDAASFWDALNTLHFLRPAWLLALFPVTLLVWLQLRAEDPIKRFGKLIAPHLLEHLVVSPDAGSRRFRPLHLIVLLLVLGIVGTAGPTWKREPSPFAADTAPVMVALDLSQAMDAIDVAPSRLERAKQKIRDFLDGRPGAKTGLLAYAGSAHLVLPPTEDAAIYTTFLDALSTGLMPVPGSDALAALGRAIASLDRQDVPGTIVLVTGTMTVDLDAVRQLVDDLPHQVLVLAVGTEQGGPIRVGEDRFLDENGRRVISRLDTAEFEALRDATGSYVTRATVDDTDVRRLLGRTRSHLESALERDSTQDWTDSGYWLTWPAALLGLLWFRRGWTVRWDRALAAGIIGAVLASLSLGAAINAQDRDSDGRASPAAREGTAAETRAKAAPASGRTDWWTDLWWTPDQQGRRLYEAGRYAEAARRFEDPRWRGAAAYRAADWDAAIDAFAGVPTPVGSFNLGNAYARKGEYELAIAAYDQALADNPEWDAAIANRELVLAQTPPQPEEEENDSQGQPTFSADQIEFDLDKDQGERGEVDMAAFSDDQMAEMWLRQLTTSPAGFLRTKFAIQAARTGTNGEEDP